MAGITYQDGIQYSTDAFGNPIFNIQLTGRNVQQAVTLFDGVTKGIANNNTVTIAGLTGDRLILELQLANTTTPSATVIFQIKGPIGSTASSVQGSDISDATQLVSTVTLSSTTPKVYIFEDMAGLDFILTLTAISGVSAALTAKARQVA